MEPESGLTAQTGEMRLVPEVSICIPTYNRERYLQETLASVFAQTYKDYEVIVVDDGSTDGTPRMMKEMADRVRYHWQENRGEAAARNKLVELAQGRFLSFIDSDDLLVPDAIERMVAAVEAESEDVIVYGPYRRIDENGRPGKRCKHRLYSGHITERLFQEIVVHPNGSMWPKTVLEDIGEFDTSLRVCTDYDLALRASTKYRFIALREPTFLHRRHANNVSGYSFANCKAQLDMLHHFYHHGGKAFISPRRATKRLAKQGYRAGRCALREGLCDTAQQLLKQSLRKRFDLKTLFWLAVSLGLRGSATTGSPAEAGRSRRTG